MSSFVNALACYLGFQLTGSVFCLVGKKTEATHITFIRIVLLVTEVCLLLGVKAYL